jgi:glycosyltransferase involved in cell wall biosynthesis
MSISVLILTLNEERNLPACLKSVAWSDDIVVFDSFSSDATVEIARSAGARVFQRHFDNERNHRAASLQLPFKYPWVYNPDADEITPPELRDEVLQTVADANRPEAAFRVRFKNMFMGTWIRHSSLYPTWVVRLLRPEAVSFEREINLRYVINGPEGRLNNHLLHFSFNNGIAAWFDKHNRYSSAEAQELISSAQKDFVFGRLFQRDAVGRRRAIKELSFHLPARPTLRFLYSYFIRGGFLDGIAGYHYCRLTSAYEHMISLKAMEFRRRQQLLLM